MLNFLQEILLFFNTDTRRKSSTLSSLVVGAIFIASMILAIFEINWILSLLSPVKFLVIFCFVGIAIGFLLYVVLAKAGLVEPQWKSFWIVLVSGLLLSISLGSRINRSGISEFKENAKALVLRKPNYGENIVLVYLKLDKKNFTLRTSLENGDSFIAGQKAKIKRFPGNLGFEVIAK